MSPTPVFDPGELLRVLARHRVRFVLIGGFAAVYHGSAHVTFDVDISPATAEDNLVRLSAALDELGAQVRAGEDAVPFTHDGPALGRAQIWDLVTPHGDLDISFMPSGTHGYDDLHRDAIEVEVLGIEIEVASLADVVRSKEAAGRPKDLLVLPLLRRLLEAGG